MQAERVHEAVHEIGGAREIAAAFQQCQHGEEHGEDRHEGDDDAGAAEDALGQQIDEPRGRPGQNGVEPALHRRDHSRLEPRLHRRRERKREPEGQAEGGEQQQQPPERMECDPVQPVGETDLPEARPRDGGAHHARDPLVAAAGDVEHRVFVLCQQGRDRLPHGRRQPGARQGRNLAIALEQLERHPVAVVRRRCLRPEQRADLREHVAVRRGDRRARGSKRLRRARERFSGRRLVPRVVRHDERALRGECVVHATAVRARRSRSARPRAPGGD